VKNIFLPIVIVLLLLTSSVAVHAKIGVGVGTGKIQVEENLFPGVVYELPPLTVVNTGDEVSQYSVGVSYHEKQPELLPETSWIQFSPATFTLEPGQVQAVSVVLNLPVSVTPGEYFAYLEAYPITTTQAGETSVGIAAAAKLYFTIQPASLIDGVYYKLLSLWNLYSPWPERAAIGIGVLAILLLFKKFFNIQVNLKSASAEQEQ